jgi:nucleotide-binding universal stress UspA family protein
MVMKIPRMTRHDGAENLVGYEVEMQIMPALQGRHVPRFVAAGDLSELPYLVMERIMGETLEHIMACAPAPMSFVDIARWGVALAKAVHSLHQQNVCHMDLKPANVLMQADGRAVLLDFGLSCHAHMPDLLAEELRKAVGSPAWMAPEQVVGVRGDARSDVFAVGVILYEMVTGKLPFGSPQTAGGLRQRLWMDPRPVRQLRPDAPAWLQEIIMRCLEPEAADRYASAAQLVFDLTHPDQVTITERGLREQGTGFWVHFKRWVRAAGREYKPSPLPRQLTENVPMVMVGVPHQDVSDEALDNLREAVARSLGLRPGARLSCVTVVSGSGGQDSESEWHRQHLVRMQRWAEGLPLQGHQVSYHVLESNHVADALLAYAKGNHVNLIILGAATHGLSTQRFIATVPIKVAMHAPCTVILVKGTRAEHDDEGIEPEQS